jgi:hypothetical protein
VEGHGMLCQGRRSSAVRQERSFTRTLFKYY